MTYRIRDWDKHYENNRTRDMKTMSWVPVPNKHDGEGFATIMHEPDGVQILGAWLLILQVASKSHPRGTLLRDSRTPHTALSIAIKTRVHDKNIIQRALDFLSSPQVAWIEHYADNPAPSCGNPAPSCAEGRKEGTEGTEQNGRNIIERESSANDLSTLSGQAAYIIAARQDWNLQEIDVANTLRMIPDEAKRQEIARTFAADCANMVDRPKNPLGYLRGYVNRHMGEATKAPGQQSEARKPSMFALTQQRDALKARLMPIIQGGWDRLTAEQANEAQRLRGKLKAIEKQISELN